QRRSIDLRPKFEDQLKQASSSLTADQCGSFLSQLLSDESPSPSIVPIDGGQELSGSQSSLAAIAITTIAKHDDADQLDELNARVERLAQADTVDWQVTALRSMLATVTQSDQAAKRCLDLLPLVPEGTSVANSMTPERSDRWGLVSPALLALEAESHDIRDAGRQLAQKLIPLLVVMEKQSLAQSLRMRMLSIGDRGSAELAAAFTEMLDDILPVDSGRKIISDTLANECLSVAKQAIQSKVPEVALEAIRRAFRNGPPMTVTKTSNDPFGAPQRSSFISSSVTARGKTDPYSDRLRTLVQEILNVESDDAQQTKKLAVATLTDVIMPQSRPGEVFSHNPKPFSDRQSAFSYQGELIADSFTSQLAEYAVESGSAEMLKQRVDERLQQTANNLQLLLLRVELAAEEDDFAAVQLAANDLLEACVLSSESSVPKQSIVPKRAAMPAVAAARSGGPSPAEVADVCLFAAEKISEKWPDDPLGRNIKASLAELATTDTTLASQYRYWVTQAKRTVSDEQTSSAEAIRAVAQLRKIIVTNYTRYSTSASGDRALRGYTCEAIEKLLERHAWDDSLDLDQVAKWMREVALGHGGLLTHDRPQFLSWFAPRLSQLNAPARYKFLSAVLLGDDPDDDRLANWGCYLLYDVPPEELLGVTPLYKSMLRFPFSAPNLPITTIADLAAQAAADAEQSESLIKRLQQRVKQDGDETDAIIGLVHLAAGDVPAATESLRRVATHVKRTIPASKGDHPLRLASGVLIAQALAEPSMQANARQASRDFLLHTRRTKLGLPTTFFLRTLAKAGQTQAAGATEGLTLKHFAASQIPYGNRPDSVTTEPLFDIRGSGGNGSLIYAAGADQNLIHLRYPLAGDYTIRYRNVPVGYSDTGIALGGIAYLPTGYNKNLQVNGLVSRGSQDFKAPMIESNSGYELHLRVEEDSVVAGVNGQDIITDKRRKGAPFVSLHTKAFVTCELTDIRIEGNPIIPRKVSLLGPELNGWSCLTYSGSLPDLDLPNESGKNASPSTSLPYGGTSQSLTWQVEKGELKSGSRQGRSSEAGMCHLLYLRPLYEDESVTTEFYYEPGKSEVHPTIGRSAVLLRPDGVRLRWLAKVTSLESRNIPVENESKPTRWVDDGESASLKPNAWNQVTLTSEADTVLLSINGQDICRFQKTPNQKFGLLREKDRTTRVRSITLKGPWPEQVPKSLMETK
ncbi:MAG: DUF1583 domain-containing protein, partial [Planctomycetota bacterium]